MAISAQIISMLGRRRFIQGMAIVSGALATFPAWAADFVDLDLLAGGPKQRDLTTAFPQKRQMILQRTRPPLLETPFEVFDRDIFTPNNQFYVRWHWAGIPEQVDVASFRMTVRGHVKQPLSLSMADVMAMPRVDLAAVNQCSAIPAGCSSRAWPARNGRTGRWEMHGGPVSACAMCWIAQASRPEPSRFVSRVLRSRSWKEHHIS